MDNSKERRQTVTNKGTVCPSRQVQAKESMMTILAVCMIGTSKILETMAASLDAQVRRRWEVSQSRSRAGRRNSSVEMLLRPKLAPF